MNFDRLKSLDLDLRTLKYTRQEFGDSRCYGIEERFDTRETMRNMKLVY